MTSETSKLISTYARTLLLTSALAFLLPAAPALAVPVSEMRAEDLLAMATEFRKELNLNPNQSTLWQQTENRTRALLRERQSRRERMQAALRPALDRKDVELRELAGGLDAEAAASAAEERQLRAWWLDVNDALDETQRKQAAVFLAEQMQRVAGGALGERGERPKEGGAPGRGEHKGKGGMGGGMGGMGGGRGG
ncbi:hypothetical protein ASD15_20805 [Massilia sp. Root351]|jgi:hypothetical protein|uniref:hypothetical protein n=1 Tax=Massilia sp. Root351 TaxID=1736522 RepID=UPI00070AD2EE|nr:hypothetical protein [Massilia sp. Root351]KQV79103.1 hypothetical protein ASD15_20805 [Massilia sp. Root351]